MKYGIIMLSDSTLKEVEWSVRDEQDESEEEGQCYCLSNPEDSL